MSDLIRTSTTRVRGAATGEQNVPVKPEQFDDWLAGHDAEVTGRALNDAANDWQRGEWANAPRRANQVQERIANGQYVGDWLRDRAARLTTTTEEPTT